MRPDLYVPDNGCMTQSRRSKNSVSRGRRRDGIRKVRTRRAVKKARTGLAGVGRQTKNVELSRWLEKVKGRADGSGLKIN